MIPLGPELPSEQIGYGGAHYTDYQRGQLVYRLDGPTGPELVTRGTSAVIAAPNAEAAETPFWFERQIFSLVDIPTTAPTGTHTLHVTRRRIEGVVPVESPGPSYAGQLTILPSSLTIPLPGGGTQVVTGAPTPLEFYGCGQFGCSWTDVSAAVPQGVPRPELRLTLSAAVSAVELTVTYPASVIDVVDVLEPPYMMSNHLAAVWRSDTVNGSQGTLRLGAVSGTAQIQRLSVIFVLDNGAAAILDPNAVGITVDRAWNASGQPISVSVASREIQ